MKPYWLCGLLFLAACTESADIEPQTQLPPAPSVQLKTVGKIPELMKAFDVSGLAVTAVSGKDILVSQGFGVTQTGDTYTSTSSCGLFSATKVLASITYANLSKADRIDLDAPLGTYIDDLPDGWGDIPFYRLLNHTSGITMVVNKDAFGGLVSNADSRNSDVYEVVRGFPLDYQPGEMSRYRQSGYAIAEMILQSELGESFDTLVTQYITDPAKLTQTRHPAVTADDQPAFLLSAGGYQTTADDMATLFLRMNDGTVISPSDWKSLILDETYLFDNYSLGSVIETRGDIVTLGHSGGGARANIRYAPDEKIGVMICTDDQDNSGLAIPLAQMLLHEATTGQLAPLPLQVALVGYKTMTGPQIVDAYTGAKASTGVYEFSNAQSILNRIGYSFLSQGNTETAIDIFSLNAREFPQSPNAHDSLGEALLAAGNGQGAADRYKHVLSLDPGNENATAMLKKISSQSQ